MSSAEENAARLLGQVLGARLLVPMPAGQEGGYAEGHDQIDDHHGDAKGQQVGSPQPGDAHDGSRIEGVAGPPSQRLLPGLRDQSRHHLLSMTDGSAPQDMLRRVGATDFGDWLAGALAAGGCVRPVRLRPSMLRAESGTGELVPVAGELPGAADGVVYKACGDRRASVCPPCAERYRQDTWQLIAAGLRGGKGVPAEVAGHPAVFLTLTAPSFGLVHSRRTSSTGRVLPCRPRRKPAPCSAT